MMSTTVFVRYRIDSAVHYGILEGERLRQLEGNPLQTRQTTGTIHQLSEVRTLVPCEPRQILAVGRNYRSHLKGRPAPSRPEIFYKPFNSLQNPHSPIVVPAEANEVHLEGELVVVIGRTARNASLEQAESSIFALTCGNDVSARGWQRGPDQDLQWWRAKGCDTFGPVGPVMVQGLDHRNLQLQTRLNGQVVQQQTTADLIFDCATVVSYISRYLTLSPGDLIFTGTPGATDWLTPGDVVEVEIEGIGVLSNPVEAG